MSNISAINSITGFNTINQSSGIQGIGNIIGKSEQAEKEDFKSVLNSLINKANETDASDKISNYNLMTGDLENIHDVIIAGEEADLALNLTVQVRNKVLDAYNEIMKMQV